jgi:hypothetical protein
MYNSVGGFVTSTWVVVFVGVEFEEFESGGVIAFDDDYAYLFAIALL